MCAVLCEGNEIRSTETGCVEGVVIKLSTDKNLPPAKTETETETETNGRIKKSIKRETAVGARGSSVGLGGATLAVWWESYPHLLRRGGRGGRSGGRMRLGGHAPPGGGDAQTPSRVSGGCSSRGRSIWPWWVQWRVVCVVSAVVVVVLVMIVLLLVKKSDVWNFAIFDVSQVKSVSE